MLVGNALKWGALVSLLILVAAGIGVHVMLEARSCDAVCSPSRGRAFLEANRDGGTCYCLTNTGRLLEPRAHILWRQDQWRKEQSE